MAPVVSAPTTTRPTSPTSVILDPLAGSWVPYNLKPAARTRATAISLSVAPLSSRCTLSPMATPWNRPLTTPLAVPSDHSLHSTIQPQGKTDPLLHAAAVAVNELQSFDSLSAFIRSRQQPTLAAPPPRGPSSSSASYFLCSRWTTSKRRPQLDHCIHRRGDCKRPPHLRSITNLHPLLPSGAFGTITTRLQHHPLRTRCPTFLWTQTPYLPPRLPRPEKPEAAPDMQLIRSTRQPHTICKRHYGHLLQPHGYAIWVMPPPPPAKTLGSEPAGRASLSE